MLDEGPLRDLLVFHNIARALTSSFDRDAILKAIMQQMDRFFEPETWSLLLLDEEKKDLFYAVVVGDAEEQLSDIRVKLGEGIAGWVAEHGETLIVPELAMDPRFQSAPEAQQGRALGNCDSSALRRQNAGRRSALQLPSRHAHGLFPLLPARALRLRRRCHR